MAILTTCRVCGKRLPLFTRSHYCSPAHQRLHDDYQRSLYLARLAGNSVEVERLNSTFGYRSLSE